MSSPSVEAPTGTRTLTFAQAVNEALAEEMRRDQAVFVIGEDVAEAGTPFKVLAGLVEEFGPERVVDSPISEPGITALGVADVRRVGEDVTIVATSSMIRVALAAAEQLESDGISAEVIDPRTLVPLDVEALVRSAEKTGCAIVVDEGHQRYGVSAELAAVIADRAFYRLDAPAQRLAALAVCIPFSPPLA